MVSPWHPILIGAGLAVLLFVLNRLWPNIRKPILYGVGIVAILLIGVGIAGLFGLWEKMLTSPLVKNGGFEHGLAPWRYDQVPGVKAIGEIDSKEKFPQGYSSFRLHYGTEPGFIRDKWAMLSQRITGLRPNTPYIVKFRVKAKEVSKTGAVFLTVSPTWNPTIDFLAGEYDWTPREEPFFTDETTFVDLRFVAQARATIWIDDVQILEAKR